MQNEKRKQHTCTSTLLILMLLTMAMTTLVSCSDVFIRTSYLSTEAALPLGILPKTETDSITATISRNNKLLATITPQVTDTKISIEKTINVSQGDYDLAFIFTDTYGHKAVYHAGQVRLTPAPEEMQILPRLLERSYIISMPTSSSFNEGESIDLPLMAYPLNATIHYTTDGSEPTDSSTQYTGPLHITETTTIKAIAMAQGCVDSAVSSGTYTKKTGISITLPPSAPNISIVTNDYITYASVATEETGMEEIDYTWYLNGLEKIGEKQCYIVLNDLVPGIRNRLTVRVKKGNHNLLVNQYFTIPESTGAEE